jgi:hypothetical protein
MSSDGSTWSLRAQTVLYDHEPEQIWRLLHGLDAAARKVIDAGLLERVEWALGDNSEIPIFGDADISAFNDAVTDALSVVTYEAFSENLGSSGGHNQLAAGCSNDLLLILNPDTYPSPTALTELVRRLAEPRIGLVEARQIPLEHPRKYDLFTGETSWASTCCVVVRRQLFDELGGFDSKHFFLHCDDVDFSWRARKLGYQVVIEPHAVVFHDKRPTPDAAWPAPDYEIYHSAFGRLMLATRWGRPDIVDETIASIEAGQVKMQLEALADFRSRVASGRVPATEAGSADIAQFIDGEYAVHRF